MESEGYFRFRRSPWDGTKPDLSAMPIFYLRRIANVGFQPAGIVAKQACWRHRGDVNDVALTVQTEKWFQVHDRARRLQDIRDSARS